MTDAPTAESYRWYRELNGYQWFVLIVAALGWLLDCFDQQLFLLARQPAMKELLSGSPSPATIDEFGGYATSVFMMGWGIGGFLFGVLGDRIGRVKTMMITILMYSGFTGLSAISTGFGDFILYRFLTGMGVGGEFAVGVSLVAEVMPDRARPYCLGLLQALSAVGNISAALVGMSMGALLEAGRIDNIWRPMFIIGAVPALLVVVIRIRLKEPERWQQVSHEGDIARKLGSYRELFAHAVWRRHAIVGLGLAFAGIVGLWGVGFYAFDLVGNVLTDRFVADVVEQQSPEEVTDSLLRVFSAEETQSLSEQSPLDIARALARKQRELALASGDAAQVAESESIGRAGWFAKIWQEVFRPKEAPSDAAAGEQSPQQKSVLDRVFSKEQLAQVNANRAYWKAIASMMMNIGAALGMYGFAVLAQRTGRKPAFAVCFLAALVSTASVFYFLNEFHQIFWMIPIMGFCILSLFAGYAIYFPELFPTHLRSTGTSFCYNVGRIVAAVGPGLLGWLTGTVYAGSEAPLRYAGLTMCGIFLLGLLVLPFCPETKGKPLPD
ncbi:MAG: MFS transporter [Planctomycetaceae bacterium]|nr:MFS transporter [Planctomycetaceae bacterium]